MSHSSSTFDERSLFDTSVMAISSSSALNLPTALGSYFRLPLKTQLLDVFAYRIKNIDVPRTFYTIKTGELTFGLQGITTGAQQLVIPAGNYTYVQLQTYIQTQWVALTGTSITVDFGGPQFKLVVTRTAGTDATIAITATQLALPGMTRILGFNAAIPTAVSLTAQLIFHLIGPNEIYVTSTVLNLGNNMQSSSVLHNGLDGQISKTNIIYMMPQYGNMGSYVNSVIPGEWQYFGTTQNLQSLDFGLVDEDGVEIMLNGAAWGIFLEFKLKRGVQ